MALYKLMQFKWVPTKKVKNKEVAKKYTGCNLKTSKLLVCVFIGVCVITRSKTVLGLSSALYLHMVTKLYITGMSRLIFLLFTKNKTTTNKKTKT